MFGLAIASLLFSFKYHTRAFPEHNIHFEITRQEAAERASAFAQTMGHDLAGFKRATVFETNDFSKIYLEKEVGVKETARLAENQIDLWHFTTRFFKPLEREEYWVSFLPNGRLVVYIRSVEEETAGANLSKEDAQKLAEKFLAEKTTVALSECTIVDTETVKKPNRTDHTFTWEIKKFGVKDASYRLEVGLLGKEIGSYSEYLKIPDSWVRNYERERSKNRLAGEIASFIEFLLFHLSLFFIFIKEFRRNNLRPRFGWQAAGVAVVISLLEFLNSLPFYYFSYQTKLPWEVFIGWTVLTALLTSLIEGLWVFLIVAAGEALYRSVSPEQFSVEATFTRGLHTKRVNQGLLVGTLTGISFFAYQVMYYFAGKKVGFWTPADTNYNELVSTVLPWIYPLSTGFMAAVAEEGVFRLFGIPFLKKYLKSTWAAILITSVVWAFLHSSYPQSPWYARGLEISVVGIVLGILFVRYGIGASFTAHYTFNALSLSIFYYRAQSKSSLLVSLLPFFVSAGTLLVLFVQKKGFTLRSRRFINKNVPNRRLKIPERGSIPVAVFSYRPFSKKMSIGLIVLAVLAAMISNRIDPKIHLENPPVAIGFQDALKTAKEELKRQGVATEGLLTSIIFYRDRAGHDYQRYLLEKAGFEKLKEVYESKVHPDHWCVNLDRPLRDENYEVDVLPDGRIYKVHLGIDEEAAGANLSKEEAVGIAKDYLTRVKKCDMAKLEVVEYSASKLKNRTDHSFTFEEKGLKVAEATFRISLSVVGNKPSSFTQYVKIPEDWYWQRGKQSLPRFAVYTVELVLGIAVIVLCVLAFFQLLRQKKINFKQSFKLAAITGIFTALEELNRLPSIHRGYSASSPLIFHWIRWVTMSFLSTLSFYLGSVLALSFFIALWKEFLGRLCPPRPLQVKPYHQNALIAGCTVPFLSSAVSGTLSWVLISHGRFKGITISSAADGIENFFPFISAFSTTLDMILAAACGACVLLAIKRYLKRWRWVLVFMIVSGGLGMLALEKNLADLWIDLVKRSVTLGGSVIVIYFITRNNLLAYLYMIYWTSMLSLGSDLFDEGNMYLKINGALVILMALLPLVLYFKNAALRGSLLSEEP